MLPKDLSPNKIKTVVSSFYLKYINNSFDHTSIYMALLVHKNI